jgi:hypothetical protein
MTKQASPEYAELKQFFAAFFEHVAPPTVPSGRNPIALLDEMSVSAPAKAFAGLRDAVNDCIEMSAHWSVERVAALDAALKARHVLTLSQVRQRYWSKYRSILKRGRIQNDVEYYLARGILADLALPMDAAERQKLESMSEAYEQRAL